MRRPFSRGPARGSNSNSPHQTTDYQLQSKHTVAHTDDRETNHALPQEGSCLLNMRSAVTKRLTHSQNLHVLRTHPPRSPFHEPPSSSGRIPLKMGLEVGQKWTLGQNGHWARMDIGPEWTLGQSGHWARVHIWPEYTFGQSTHLARVHIWPEYTFGQSTHLARVHIWPEYTLARIHIGQTLAGVG